MKKMNLLKTAIAMLIMIFVAANAVAKNPFAEFVVNGGDNTKGTLTFYYNDKYDSDVDMTLNSGSAIPVWITKHRQKITKVVFDESFKDYKPYSCHSWFEGCENLESIENLKYLKLDNVSDMGRMFYNCKSLKHINFSDDNSHPSYQTVDFSNMFYGCESLEELYLMSRPEYKYNYECNLSHMFYGCKSLTSAKFDMSKFSTQAATNMRNMFSKCEKLTVLNLSHFNTRQATKIQQMFSGCSNLQTIYVSDGWITDAVENATDCFFECTQLVGGKGTTYDDTQRLLALEYARIDQGLDNPGYLTPFESQITYNFNGGSVSGNPTSYTIETLTFTLKNPTRNGYIFNGWSGTDIDGLSKSVTISKGSTYPREYTAHWICDLSSTANTIKITPSSKIYFGEPITFTITINGEPITEGIDYTLDNPELPITAAGVYSVKIIGIGSFSGSKTLSLTIDAQIDVTVTPDAITKTYGDPDPELTYTTKGLPDGEDLGGSLSREVGEDVGEYAITGEFTNIKYKVTIEDVVFTIEPKTLMSPTVVLESDVAVYTGKEIKPAVKILDGSKVIPASEYTVQYADNVDKDIASVTVINATGGNYIITPTSAKFEIVDRDKAFKVTFVTSGIGPENKDVYVLKNSLITIPSDIFAKGYTLEGFFTDEEFSNEWDFDTDLVTEDIILYALWQPNPHKIDFEIDGDYPMPSLSTYYGEKITLPTMPAKTGYTFSWIDELPATMPDEDIIIHGTYTINSYKLVYTLDGKEFSTETIPYGTTLKPAVIPAARTGYTFSGWSEIPTTMPDHDVNISGSFTANKHNLVFKVDGEAQPALLVGYGTLLTNLYPRKAGYEFVPATTPSSTMPDEDLTIAGTFQLATYHLNYYVDGTIHYIEEHHFGDVITPIAEPEIIGSVFSGWSEIPATMPAENVSVDGTFTPKQYTLTYKIDGEVYQTYNKIYGAYIGSVIVKAKEGYTFSGWDEEPSVMPASDIVISGSYIKNKYTITYTVDGEVYKTDEVEYGATITPADQPTKEGFTFSGWNLNYQTMPNFNVTVWGTFVKNSTTPVADINTQSAARVWSYNGTIYIETAPDTKYKIIDLNGRVVTTSTTKSNREEIHINQSGILIVVIENQSFKVVN